MARAPAFLSRIPVLRHWLAGEDLPRHWHLVLGLLLPGILLGWHMQQVWSYTVDDAYISFRYARNLMDGHGLVYNHGQRIEGYTNFLWTVLLAGGMGVGIDPHWTAKVLGAAAAFGTLVAVYLLSSRARPLSATPCLATWLLASSAPFAGYAVLGLETAGFACLICFALLLTLDEEDRDRKIPWSGVLFAAAALTRPEAPLFAGLALLSPGRKMFSRRNLLRGILFAVPVLIHLMWRRMFYGLWVPFTYVAKMGDTTAQYGFGKVYLLGHLDHAGPLLLLGLFGLGLAVYGRGRGLRLLAAVSVAWYGWILTSGGDWMTFYRFMAPIEPILFVLCGVAARTIFDHRDRAATLGLALLIVYGANVRHESIKEAHHKWLQEERPFWRRAAGQAASWLLRQPPGIVGIGDIGYVGYKTSYPVLDFLGLVDPAIGRLPGGYTRKLGPGFTKRIFTVMPDYLVFILSGQNCDKPDMPGSKQMYRHRKFQAYELGQNIQVGAHASWCIFQLKNPRTPR